MMKIETSAEISSTAAERWKRQYQNPDGTWSPLMRESSKAIYEKILDANGDPEKIAEAIGNKGWSFVICRGCGREQHFVASFGLYEIETRLCHACMSAGIAAIEAVCRFAGMGAPK